MRRTIGIGVIGMGWMGEAHSRSYRLVGDRFHDRGIDAQLVVCADADPGRAGPPASDSGFERATTDWQAVIADPAVEAISITAPNDIHLAVIRAALAAGKHVLCEKPVGRTPAETARGGRAGPRDRPDHVRRLQLPLGAASSSTPAT